MDHSDHVALLRGGVPVGAGGVWADLGAGTGAFTLALADLLGPGATIYTLDRDRSALRALAEAMRAHFPATTVHPIAADFTRRLELPPLDGVVMANSLHFQRHKEPVLALVLRYLRPGGRLLLVEYNADRGNPWVPYPLSYPSWEELARRAGFRETRQLAARPSRFLHEIYSAVSLRP
jgi:SAM-dependent methyltransferase